MNAELKLAWQRPSVPELAQALGDASNACRRRVMMRTEFADICCAFRSMGSRGGTIYRRFRGATR